MLAQSYEPSQKKFTEEDLQALWKATDGNPLEAREFLVKWKSPLNNDAQF